MEPDDPKPPKMNRNERRKLKLAYVVLIVAALAGLAIVVWLAWIRPAQQSADIGSFDECVSEGYPVQEGDPPVCVTPDGTKFTGPSPAKITE